MATVRARVVIRGIVQGVYFRDSARREALARGVAGWVRNTSAGDVEAVFEGDADAVDEMVAWARIGPPRAQVDSVEREDEAPEGLNGFDIRY